MGGGGNQEVTQNTITDPWGPSKPYLEGALGNVSSLFNSGGYNPYVPNFDTYANFSGAQNQGMGAIMGTARQQASSPYLDMAMAGLGNLSQGGYSGPTNQGALRDLINGGGNPIVGGGFLRNVQQGQGSGQGMLANVMAGDTRGQAVLADMTRGQGAGMGMLEKLIAGQGGKQDVVRDYATGNGYGQEQIGRMVGGKNIYRDLDKVKSAALGSAVPAAASMFAGSGMIGSTPAMDYVGRAATEAVAPIEYGAWNDAQNRSLAAQGQIAGQQLGAQGQLVNQKLASQGQLASQMMGAQGQNMAQRMAAQGQNMSQMMGAQGQLTGQRMARDQMQAGNTLAAQGQLNDQLFQRQQLAQQGQIQASTLLPSLLSAQYLPGQMMNQVGGQRQAQNQGEIDARMQRQSARANQDNDALSAYVNQLLGVGNVGGSSSGSAMQPGQSFGSRMAGGALGGLGAYGALAANPVTAPFALPAGLAAGLLGLF